MLSGTLGASLLENLLTGKSSVRAGEGRTSFVPWILVECRLILELILKYKSITRKNQNLMVSIQEVIYLKKEWGIFNKSWWVWVNRNSLY